MGLSSPAEREKFLSYPDRPCNWWWLDEQGRCCAPERASMVRIRKRVIGERKILTVVVDASEFDLMAPDGVLDPAQRGSPREARRAQEALL